jgi:hypothetical protein
MVDCWTVTIAPYMEASGLNPADTRAEARRQEGAWVPWAASIARNFAALVRGGQSVLPETAG